MLNVNPVKNFSNDMHSHLFSTIFSLNLLYKREIKKKCFIRLKRSDIIRNNQAVIILHAQNINHRSSCLQKKMKFARVSLHMLPYFMHKSMREDCVDFWKVNLHIHTHMYIKTVHSVVINYI